MQKMFAMSKPPKILIPDQYRDVASGAAENESSLRTASCLK